MIRRIIPGILVLGLVTGLSGTLADIFGTVFHSRTGSVSPPYYDRALVRFVRITDEYFSAEPQVNLLLASGTRQPLKNSDGKPAGLPGGQGSCAVVCVRGVQPDAPSWRADG